jgi:F-box-like
MSKFSLNTALARLENKLRQLARRGESQSSIFAFRAPNCESVKHIIKKPHSPISVLNDDVLLHIFYIHRLHIELQDDSEDDRYGAEHLYWDHQRWWYKLAHVSRRWRRVILAAPSLLDLHLVCTYGMPVADMLAHPPLAPLPLTIFYWFNSNMTLKEEDEKGALLALSRRDRVHRIALYMRSSELERLFVAMDGQFPVLEHLRVISLSSGVALPRTFEAPNLYHGNFVRVAFPIQCPQSTPTGLVSLQIRGIPSSAYFPPSYILASLSLMPQLETLCIMFDNRDADPVRDTAITSHATLPNLRKFEFRGVNAYLEELCAWMTAPVLSVLRVEFFNQHTFAVPHLLSFMQTSENLQSHAVMLDCGTNSVSLLVCGSPQLRTRNYPFKLQDLNIHPFQISSALWILDALSPVLSLTEQVSLVVDGGERSVWYDQVDRTQWHGLFRSFNNVRKLYVKTTLVRGLGLGHSLCTEDGKQPPELLPNLEEVICTEKHDEEGFIPFIIEREAVGRPVRLRLESGMSWSWYSEFHTPDI